MVLGIVSDQNIQRFLCVLGAPQLIREESKKNMNNTTFAHKKVKIKVNDTGNEKRPLRRLNVSIA